MTSKGNLPLGKSQVLKGRQSSSKESAHVGRHSILQGWEKNTSFPAARMACPLYTITIFFLNVLYKLTLMLQKTHFSIEPDTEWKNEALKLRLAFTILVWPQSSANTNALNNWEKMYWYQSLRFQKLRTFLCELQKLVDVINQGIFPKVFWVPWTLDTCNLRVYGRMFA